MPSTVILTWLRLTSIGHLTSNNVELLLPVNVCVSANEVIKNVPVTRSNLLRKCIALILLLPICAAALAILLLLTVDKLPSISIVGADKYPEPGFVTSMLTTLPPDPNLASPLAPVPPPPTNLITGISVYPIPLSLMLQLVISKPTLSNQCLFGYVLNDASCPYIKLSLTLSDAGSIPVSYTHLTLPTKA